MGAGPNDESRIGPYGGARGHESGDGKRVLLPMVLRFANTGAEAKHLRQMLAAVPTGEDGDTDGDAGKQGVGRQDEGREG